MGVYSAAPANLIAQTPMDTGEIKVDMRHVARYSAG